MRLVLKCLLHEITVITLACLHINDEHDFPRDKTQARLSVSHTYTYILIGTNSHTQMSQIYHQIFIRAPISLNSY